MMQTAAEAGGPPPLSMAKSPAQHFHEPAAISTAGRLKYADPRSLPSFPSAGLSSGGAAASAAASLGWSSQKPVEPWRPDKTSSASAAAILAKNYKMSKSWEPAANSAGAKAAILAVGSAGAALKKSNEKKTSQDSWGNSAAMQAFNAHRPTSAEPANLSHGSSAATQAFKTNRSQSIRQAESPPSPQADRSLVAAKGAMSSSRKGNRARSQTLPQRLHPSDATAASSSALNGATIAHRASMNRTPIEDSGAISVTNMTRNMFTSHPPVKPEVDEQTTNERIHQSAVEMAKKMYQQQQKKHHEESEGHEGSVDTHTSPYVNLQDAAYKQAQERLAKLQDEHSKSRQYQEYYGNQKSPRRRFSVINKLRRRSSSDGDMGDRERSEQIRHQMSLFSSQLSRVDQEKREKDRDALLAAAQRNVKARLQGMDEKVYHKTGKINPTMFSDWELKAQQAAQSRHDTRTEAGKDKIDLGGGRFMDSSEVDAIAARMVQPVLDDIQEKADAERERLATVKVEEEAKKADADREKARERELREIQKKSKEEDKQQEKARKLQEKQDEKSKKEEQRRQAKDEKRKSKAETAGHNQDGDNEGGAGEEGELQNSNEVDTPGGGDTAPESAVESAETRSQRKSSETPTSPTSRVKGWIKNRFSRGKSFGDNGEKRRGFIGGAALRESGVNGSTTSIEHRPSSIRDVALAGKGQEENSGHEEDRTNQDSRGVSPVSSSAEVNRTSDERASLDLPKPIKDNVSRLSSSPLRDSRFREMMDH